MTSSLIRSVTSIRSPIRSPHRELSRYLAVIVLSQIAACNQGRAYSNIRTTTSLGVGTFDLRPLPTPSTYPDA